MAKKQILNKKINLLKLFLLPSLLIVLLLIIITIPFTNKIFPNVYVSGIYLGDKNKDLALQTLKDNFKLPSKIRLDLNGSKNDLLTSEVVTNVDYSGTIERAYNYSNSGNLVRDVFTKAYLIIKPINLSTIINLEEDKLLETLLILSNDLGQKPEDPSVKKMGSEIVLFEGKNGVVVDIEKARNEIGEALSFSRENEIKINFKEIKVELTQSEKEELSLRAKSLINKSLVLTLDKDNITLNDEVLLTFLNKNNYDDDRIKAEILKSSKKLNRNPQDSVFIMENGKAVEFTPSKEGITVNEDALLTEIKNSLDRIVASNTPQIEIAIPAIKVSPKIKNEDVNSLGIKSLLGKGFSTFKGSIPNRIYNVNLAQSRFRGIMIPPNEVVSFNDVLGDVSSLTGYKAAYVIKDGKTVLGDGGGVCQVSTTLFRAVLNAGLPVIERRAHAYRVGYYEQGFGPGLDATVYSPTTDFKFKNDTPAYILIQPYIDLNNLALTFEIYGTDDGRVATTSKPIIMSSVAPAADLYVDDPTLKAGVIKQIEHKAYGAKVVFDYKVTRNGEELINQRFISNYRPWQAVYLRGIMQ